MAFQPPKIEFEILDGGLSAGTTAPPDGPLWILGPASTGPFTPFPASQAQDVKTTFGYGAGVEANLFALNNEVSQTTFLRVDPTDGTEGAYGAITVEANAAGFSVIADPSTPPGDDWDPIVEVTRGGTIGALPGPKYRYSLDNGQKFSGERDMGTDNVIALPYGAGRYTLVGEELTVLLARLTDVRAQVLGHVEETGVHGSVDAGPYTITAPVDDASALTCCADLKTVALAHVAKTSGSPAIHGAADQAAGVPLTALVAPASRAQAVAFVEAFVAIFFGDEDGTIDSGHTVRTANAVHGSADAVNVLTSDPAVAGDLAAGDRFYLGTTGPRWSIERLVEAIRKVKDSNAAVNGVLEIVGPVLTSGEAQAIEDALEGLGEKYRDVRAIGHWRARNPGESQQAYAAAFELAHPLAASSGRQGRLALMSWYYPPSQLVPGAASARPKSFAMAPRLARLGLAANPISEVDVGTFKGALRAANGYDVLPKASDETFAPTNTAVRLWSFLSDGGRILSSRPVTLAPDGSDFALIQYGRVIDAVKKSAYASLKRRMGQKVAPKPGTVLIDPNEAKRISEAEALKLREEFVKKGQADGVRVEVGLNSVVSGAGTKVAYVGIYVRPVGYFEDIQVTLQFAL